MGIVVFDGVAYGMLLFLIGVGLSITMGLMNFVNLAHGTFAMVGGYAASVLMNRLGVGFFPSLIAAFVAAALVGALPFTLPPLLDGRVSLLGLEVGRYRLFLILCGVAVLVTLLLVLGKTRYGAMVRAAVDNQRVARGTGIHVQRLFFLTFSLGCGLAGLGGALSLGMLGLEPSFPLKYLVYFLIVVCVGGAGTVTGPFVAALLVGIVDMAGKYYLPEAGAFLIYVVMIVMLLFRPNGIIPRKGLTS
jgi:branched-chain amino acid transport system permease protein